jgi:hypothetical protein
VPAPDDGLIAGAEALRKYARYKPVVATLKAKRAGRASRYAKAVSS